jgi:hypothetical protein
MVLIASDRRKRKRWIDVGMRVQLAKRRDLDAANSRNPNDAYTGKDTAAMKPFAELVSVWRNQLAEKHGNERPRQGTAASASSRNSPLAVADDAPCELTGSNTPKPKQHTASFVHDVEENPPGNNIDWLANKHQVASAAPPPLLRSYIFISMEP